MSNLVEDVLEAWREAERLLDGGTAGPDRARLEVAIAELRTLYAGLTATGEVTTRKLARATTVLQQSHRIIEDTRRRLDDPATERRRD